MTSRSTHHPPEWIWPVALGVVALVVRLVAASTSGVYVDEAFTYFISRSDFAGMVAGSHNDLNPPAWYFVLHPLAVLTRSPFWLRLPALLCAVVSVPIAWLIARDVLATTRRATMAASFLALAYSCWLVDTQIRAYGVTLLLTNLALWLFTLTCRDERPPVPWPAYGSVCVLLPCFHYLGVLAGLALAVASIRTPVSIRRRLLLVHSMALLPGIAWLVFSAAGNASNFHAHHPDILAFLHVFTLPEYLTGIVLPFAWRSVPGADSWASPALQWARYVVNLALWLAVAAGIRYIRNEKPALGAGLGLMVAVPLLGLALGATLGIQPYQHRYNVVFAAPFFILLVAGLARFRLEAVAFGLLAINAMTVMLFASSPFLWNQNWPAAARFVESRQQPGDCMAAYIDYSLVGFDYYYQHGAVTVDFLHSGEVAFRHAPGAAVLAQEYVTPDVLNGVLDRRLGHGRVFLLLNQEDGVGGPQVRAWFRDRFHVLESFHQDSLHTWGDMTVLLLERK